MIAGFRISTVMLIRLWLTAVAAIAACVPAAALEPEQREVVVINGRVWEGHEYKEMFLPSDRQTMTLMSGADNAIVYVRTLEYYWPLSRQVYVDFERQRETIGGELVIRRDGQEIARETLQPYTILYPEGAVNGNGRLLWGEEAEQAYAEHRENERRFQRELAAASRAHSEYERRLVESGATRNRGEPVETIAPPAPFPKPSLRLVTKPEPGFRMNLEPGDYAMALEKEGQAVPATERRLRVIGAAGRETLVADIVPEERWTRPIAINTEAARIFARPGAVFYMTLAEASHFKEADYLPVLNPQAEPVAGRSIWVRRGSASVDRLEIAWEGEQADLIARRQLKVEQTRGSAFGYRVRAVQDGEQPDLDAFTISVPDDPNLSRGRITAANATAASFTREVVIVHARRATLALALALLPLAGYAVFARLRKSAFKRDG